MGVSRFYQPHVQQYQSQFVPLPLELMYAKIKEKQKVADDTAQLSRKILNDAQSIRALESQQDVVNAKVAGYETELDNIRKKYAHDPAAASSEVFDVYSRYRKDLNTGDLGVAKRNLEAHTKIMKEWNKLSPEEQQRQYMGMQGYYFGDFNEFNQKRGRDETGKLISIPTSGLYKALEVDKYLEQRFGDIKGDSNQHFTEIKNAAGEGLGGGYTIKRSGVKDADIYAEAMRIMKSPGDERLLLQKRHDLSRLTLEGKEDYAKRFAANIYGVTDKEFDKLVKEGKIGQNKIEFFALGQSIAEHGMRFKHGEYAKSPYNLGAVRKAQKEEAADGARQRYRDVAAKMPKETQDVKASTAEDAPFLTKAIDWVSVISPPAYYALKQIGWIGQALMSKTEAQGVIDAIDAKKNKPADIQNAWKSGDDFKAIGASIENLMLDGVSSMVKLAYSQDISKPLAEQNDPKMVSMLQNFEYSNPELSILREQMSQLKAAGKDVTIFENSYKQLLSRLSNEHLQKSGDALLYNDLIQFSSAQSQALTGVYMGKNRELLGAAYSSKFIDPENPNELITGATLFGSAENVQGQVVAKVDKGNLYGTNSELVSVIVNTGKGFKNYYMTIATDPNKNLGTYSTLYSANHTQSGISESVDFPATISLSQASPTKDGSFTRDEHVYNTNLTGMKVQSQKLPNGQIRVVANPNGRMKDEEITDMFGRKVVIRVLDGEYSGTGINLDAAIMTASNAVAASKK